jgi:hypothetical protein
MAEWAVHQDFGSSVAVAPREGAGATRQYFHAQRLCASGDVLTKDTWEPLRQHPPKNPDLVRRGQLLAYADSLASGDPSRLTPELRALRARVAVLADAVPDLLQKEMPKLFSRLPEASLWLVSVDEVLISRFALLRAQLALTLTPDMPLAPGSFPGIRLLSGQSLTVGTDFGNVHDPALLVFSPRSMGFSMSWFPHALILFFGQPMELYQRPEESFNALYRTRVLDRAQNWTDSAFLAGLTPAQAEALLPWWVERMNVIYSHALDPTAFADDLRLHNPASQTAWHLTFERMVSDGVLLLGDPNAPDPVRMQLAFDLLDKAENMLTYGRTGKWFEDLLKRSKAVPRLDAAWETLPDDLRERFRQHTKTVYDSMYDDIRQHALQYRLTSNGVRVARSDPASPLPVSMDEYVSRLVRAVRNSAHGLARQLRDQAGLVLATHDGEVPTQLVEVAKLVMFGLIGDADQLCAGTWW